MRNENVLVIDDDDLARTMIVSLLVRSGFRAVGLASPIGATRAIRDNDIAAVVCDLNMPAMRGDALARVIRQSHSLRSVRLLLVTATPSEDPSLQTVEGGPDAVIHKANLESELVPRLRAALHAIR